MVDRGWVTLCLINALTYPLIVTPAMAAHNSAERPREKLRVEELSSAAVAELMRNRVSILVIIDRARTCHKCVLSLRQASQRAKGLLKQARIKAKRLENSRRIVKLETMTLYGD